MKATGIVRRIDDLGRVVIPKEIRRTMRIREGTPLEIYTDREGEVIFKKYSPIGELSAFAAEYADTLHRTCGLAVIITDRDTVIATAGVPRREYAEKKISDAVDRVMESRAFFARGAGEAGEDPLADGSSLCISAAMPILTEGDLCGCVISLSTAESGAPGETECKLVQTAAGFLGRQLES